MIPRTITSVTAIDKELRYACTWRRLIDVLAERHLTVVDENRVTLEGRYLFPLCYDEHVVTGFGSANPGVDAEWIGSFETQIRGVYRRDVLSAGVVEVECLGDFAINEGNAINERAVVAVLNIVRIVISWPPTHHP
jgi:hypothetical protein